MFSQLFGFIINDNIQVDIHHRRIVRLNVDEEHKNCAVDMRIVLIKDIQMDLLVYLLKYCHTEAVDRNEILKYVWDDRRLKSSSQTLWFTLKGLRAQLARLGLDNNFISVERGSWYRIKADKIQELCIS